MLDYYRILDVERDVKQEELKSAYIKRLKQYHPDIYKGADATEKTQKINEAYQTLKDPQKRAAYDFDLRSAAAGSGSGAAGNRPGAAGGGFASFADSQIVARAAGGFSARRQALKQQIEQIIAELQDDIAGQRRAGLDPQIIKDRLGENFHISKDRLLQENAEYYQSLLHPLLQPATVALVAQFRDSQQNFISQNMDAALPQLMAAAGGHFSGAGGYAAFWWGLGLSLFLVKIFWLPLLFIALMLIFGAKTPARFRFFAGSLIGLALHWLLWR